MMLSTLPIQGKKLVQGFSFGSTQEKTMGPFSWKNFRHRDSKSASTQVSSTERALRVKLICQAVRSGTYRVSTGELADRFLARMASGQLHTSS